jgi:hypothetical protein
MMPEGFSSKDNVTTIIKGNDITISVDNWKHKLPVPGELFKLDNSYYKVRNLSANFVSNEDSDTKIAYLQIEVSCNQQN